MNMHAFFTVLVVMILLSSFLQLPKQSLVEARKLNSKGYFSVDLIHRDSPNSPFFNSSMTPEERQRKTILGSVSYRHSIRLSSVSYDSKDIQTDVVPNGGDYLMNIAIGTPPVQFVAVADTGSDLVWLQCSPCEECIQQKAPLFDPTKSTTYQTIPCSSQSCNNPDFKSGCQTDDGSCIYGQGYGDGSRSVGTLSTETISFPSTDATASFPSFIFGCGSDQKGRLGLDGDGIVGLGAGTLSLVSQLGQTISNKFAYCLTPLSSGVNSKLKFGVDVSGPGVVSTPFTNQDTLTFYSLTLDSISIGDSSVPVANDVIIDSGTTLTYLPESSYNDVRTALANAIALNPVPDPYQVLDLCYETQPSGLNPPDLTFHFQGADVVLKAINSFVGQGSVTCLAMMPADDHFIFGNIAQVNYQVGYDLQAKQVSFAPADCTQF